MADVEYMHVCDYAFSAEGGKQCIIGIFSVINANAFPAAHPYMTVATRFTGQPHERMNVRVEIGRPNGDVLAGMDCEITIDAEGGANLNANFIGLTFPDAGRYTVKVSAAGRALTTRSLRLVRMAGPGAAQPPAGPVH